MQLNDSSTYTHVEVEPNDNTPMMAMQVYKNIGQPFRVAKVRLFEGEPEGKLCAVSGWSSAGEGSAVDAYAVRIEDSSEGSAYLVYGGDWGIRLRDAGDVEPWSIEAASQWGETHLVLASIEDIVAAE